MAIKKSLKSTGKACIVLPLGVLFRGNAEASIRKKLIQKGYIKGIIGLPPRPARHWSASSRRDSES